MSDLSVSAAAPAATTSKLVKLANGEYTAASVNANQAEANKLALVKLRDGNYGTSSDASSGTAVAQSSSGVQAALSTLTLGGS